MRHLQERMKSDLTKDSERRYGLFEQTPERLLLIAVGCKPYITMCFDLRTSAQKFKTLFGFEL
jgi:hypothetical protein